MGWIEDVDPKFLLCRDTGVRHRWEPTHAVRDKQGFIETLACDRCGTVKKRYLTKVGAVRRTKFFYVPGYVRKGSGHVTVAENSALRILSLKSRWSV